MKELGPENLLAFLVQSGRLSEDVAVRSRVETLSGGVSNVVMRVFVPEGEDFVVKQSRAQLRTQAAWFSQPERIWRERDVLDVLWRVAPPGLVPKLLFEDRDNFLFAMEAIPSEHVVWKTLLLAGDASVRIAKQLGEVLAAIHSGTTDDAGLREQFGDRTIFDELRLDPFYRFVADRNPELRSPLEQLIAKTMRTSTSLVLGDFSPKNILVIGSRIVLVDFETGHFGDPAFDLGFFLSHLLLKTIKHAARVDEFIEMTSAFWTTYLQTMSLPEEHVVLHTAACMRARVDGKSTVDYLTSEGQSFVRQVTNDWLHTPPNQVSVALTELRLRLKAVCSC